MATCRCGASWGGLSPCHCTACHVTFSGIKLFDAHQIRGVCHDPADMTRNGQPLRLVDGVWRAAAMPDDALARRTGGRT